MASSPNRPPSLPGVGKSHEQALWDAQARTVLQAVGYAAFNLSYARFCELLGESDSSYARDKYQDFKALGRAMNHFSDSTLLRLATDYVQTN